MGPATTPEQQAALAASLRKREQLGAMFQLTGDRVVAPVGQQLSKTADADKQRAINQNYYRSQKASQDANLAEERRYHDMQMQMAREQNATMLSAAGMKAQNLRPVPIGVQKKLEDQALALSNVQQLAETFDPKWASSMPGQGYLKMALARNVPMLASEDTVKFAQWQGDLKRWYDMLERYKLFGATLTNNEVKSWREITVNPDSTPSQVQTYLGKILGRLQQAQELEIQGGMAQYNNEALLGYSGLLNRQQPEEQAPASNKLYSVEPE